MVEDLSLKSLTGKEFEQKGFFGKYGGQFVPFELKKAYEEIEKAYLRFCDDDDFLREFNELLCSYVGRPSPLYFARNLTKKVGGAKIFLKREDLNHTGAHKINHCLGEALLAKRMGKRKLLAETGAGQHGVALATAAAIVGLECEIHMGAIDVSKQKSNVARMRLLGAKVVEVSSGGQCLKDAVDSAFESYLKDFESVFFAIGSVVGPYPFPFMVRDFQSVVGKEVRSQILECEGRLPDFLVACVGGGSNAIGLFSEFLDDDVRMVGVEPGGRSFKEGDHAATLSLGEPDILHGMFTYLLKAKDGSPMEVHSVASGLDYPGVGPEHSFLKDRGRVVYEIISDCEAIDAFLELSRVEGIVPALESAHAVAYAMKLAEGLDCEEIVVVNLSGRGDKDVEYVLERVEGF